MNSHIKKNTIYNIIKAFSQVIFPLITFPYANRVLLPENIGKINFANAFVSYFSLAASLGITTYAVRECAKEKANRDRLDQISSEIYSINIVTLIISSIISTAILVFVPEIKAYSKLIIIYSITVIFGILGTDWINTAMEDFKFIAVRTFCVQVVSLILMFLLVKKPSDYYIYAMIMAFSNSGANILNIFYRKRYCKIHFTRKMNFQIHFPHIIVLFSMLISQMIFNSSDITILGLQRGDIEVGLYSTGVKIYNVINSLITSLNWVAMPQLARAFESKDKESVNETLKYSINFMSTFGFPMAVGMAMLSKEIIEIIGGKGYERSADTLSIMSIVLVLAIIWGLIMNFVLLSSGREKKTLISCISAAAVNILLNILFIPKYGATAAAATTAFSYFFGLIISAYYAKDLVDFKIFIKPLMRSLLGAIITGIIIFLVKKAFDNTIVILSISIILCGCICSIVHYLMKNDLVLDIVETIKHRILKR